MQSNQQHNAQHRDVEAHKFKKATRQAQRAAYDTIRTHELEEIEFEHVKLHEIFIKRKRDALR